MKKYLYIFCIIVLTFICAPLSVLGVDYKVCEYQSKYSVGPIAYIETCYLNVKNDTMYADCTTETIATKKTNEAIVYNGSGISQEGISGVDITHKAPASPKFLTLRCPKALCVYSKDTIYIDENGCSTGTRLSSLQRTVDKNSVINIEEATLYHWGKANESIVKYGSVLNGSCPSDEPVFKLFKPVYQLIKIAAPVMLVLFATIDLAKATAASDESMIKKAQKHCFKRVAAAVIVFLSFASVEMIIKLVSGGSKVMECVSEFLK